MLHTVLDCAWRCVSLGSGKGRSQAPSQIHNEVPGTPDVAMSSYVEDLRGASHHSPREACSTAGARCFDAKTNIYVVNKYSDITTAELLGEGLVAGQPPQWTSVYMGALRVDDEVITSFRDAAGNWVYETARVLQIRGYRCDRGVCRMTTKLGFCLTSDHRVRVQTGSVGTDVVWSNEWLQAHEVPGTKTDVQNQPTVINIVISSPHGVLIRGLGPGVFPQAQEYILASTLSTPLEEGCGVVTPGAQWDLWQCPYRIPGNAFRYFNLRETTGNKLTPRVLTTMLSLGRKIMLTIVNMLVNTHRPKFG